MGQIKNIKLHIDTDIKVDIHHDIETEVATKVDAVTSVTFVAPTVPDVVPRTRPSRSLSSETLWKPLQCVICLKPVFTTVTHYQSFTLNLHTASVVPSTRRL